jgi:hypothetical protein
MFMTVFGFFIIYRIFTFSYDIAYNILPASEACGSPAPYFGLIGTLYIYIENNRYNFRITVSDILIHAVWETFIGFLCASDFRQEKRVKTDGMFAKSDLTSNKPYTPFSQ